MSTDAVIKEKRIAELSAYLGSVIPLNYLSDASALGRLAARWCEGHRIWHGPSHLLAMLEVIGALPAGEDRDTLALTALYHDAIYDPRAADNEDLSAALLLRDARDSTAPVVVRAAGIILASKWSAPPQDSLTRQFFELDCRQLADDCPLHARLDYERAIFREFQWADWETYRQKRGEFLQTWARQFPEHRRGAGECLGLLEGLRPRVAVYPGSFAPFHLGHLSILRQAEAVFDKVIVAVGVNRQKPGALESARVRCGQLQAQLCFHEVRAFTGLLSDFVASLTLPATILRGVRDGTDLEAELRYTRFLNELRPGSGVVWISCEAELQHLSSSAIRELESIEPGAAARYVPTTAHIYSLS